MPGSHLATPQPMVMLIRISFYWTIGDWIGYRIMFVGQLVPSLWRVKLQWPSGHDYSYMYTACIIAICILHV